MVRAGRFDKVVKIQRQTTKANSYGGVVQSWEDLATIRASIEPLQGREFFSGAIQLGDTISRIRIRYRQDIDRTMRVVYQNRYFEITNIIDSKERHEELQLICKEQT